MLLSYLFGRILTITLRQLSGSGGGKCSQRAFSSSGL